jgi:hypothetical protein
MPLTFPHVQAWDAAKQVVAFPADNEKVKTRCAISWEALQDDYGCGQSDPQTYFQQNRAAIEATAAELIRRKRYEADGSIMIRSGD